MFAIEIPMTADGRAIPIAAFELALKRHSEEFPSETLSDRQQDAMIEVIIDLVSDGTTHIEVLADRAMRRAAQMVLDDINRARDLDVHSRYWLASTKEGRA